MTVDLTLRLDHLHLRNFRCFGECTVDLHPQLTVFVAENGKGKTAILDAIKIALGLFVDTLSGVRQYADLQPTDVRLVWQDGVMAPQLPTEFAADGYVAGQLIHWRRALHCNDDQNRPTKKDAKSLFNATQQLQDRVLASMVEGKAPPTLPLVAYYSTDRFGSEQNLFKRKTKGAAGRLSGYVNSLASSSSFKALLAWYESRMSEVSDPRYRAKGDNNLALLSAVEKAMHIVLEPTGWDTLLWDPKQKCLLVKHLDHGQLPPSMLSDGVRTMVALIMDIARRCFLLNPHFAEKSAQQTPGILLIDEIDMHLHPSWQQKVIDLLQQAFPALQMIMSTHSPQVLSTVDRNSIRVIRLGNGEGLFETPKFQTRGVENSDVLAHIMHLDPVPPVIEAKWVRDYSDLIQQHLFNTAEAQMLRTQLENHFGSQHPVISEFNRMIRLERFKQTLPALSNR